MVNTSASTRLTGSPNRPQSQRELLKAHRMQVAPLIDQMTRAGLSLRQLAYLSNGYSRERGAPALAFSHVSLSQWLSGKRNPNARHREVMAHILRLPVSVVDRAFDSNRSLVPISTPRTIPAVAHVFGRNREFHYSTTIRAGVDLATAVVYEGNQWENMFSLYPAQLRRHLNRGRARLFGWIPDDRFKPLIPFSQCLVLLKPSKVIPALNDAEAFDRRIWFVLFRSGEVGIRFMYRQGLDLVISRPGEKEQRVSKDDVDPLGYLTGSILFRLEIAEASGERPSA